MHEHTQRICDFLSEINLPYKLHSVEADTFLPGLKTVMGTLYIDTDKLMYPGDILHESGHIAVCEPIYRKQLHEDVYKNGLKNGREKQAMHAEEMAAIAWSVAAIQHIGLPIEVVLHQDGYKGASSNLIDAFKSGGGLGYPLLDAWEMTCPKAGFPKMKIWIRERRWINE
ncbi:hypothetical protein HUZ36_18855 [Pseudoalteromonas sp. McH1-7]|uniref:Uncharacterized protein n=1 Tax=Pseudoalteromonas peptidolytica F12-50-A1 TaxID=1315280 RepID=A0A8I0MZX7_9GAMM|nr:MULTISPECIES: hypothetical protein [Pseudoalteromonas]MBE0349010.1 hypothetical protein [Pseudoalteromonas peptidolytica F12-50-A1]MDW7548857.1 hypothetical protein [Pseudoalteromonas peptidolytica]NLR15842.1 hypothetical protein [Pseudoalteromonas peptidolytica]NUZ12842.1 hypothetical protein [Pseudoalteromonas sp. McH1-7]RRS08425.1 hypothetical protein EAG18_11915 [Pseudoalteromonas sp. J010]